MSDDEFWKKEQDGPREDEPEETLPQPITVRQVMADAIAAAVGVSLTVQEDAWGEYYGEPLSEEEIVEDPEALRRAQEVVDRIQEPSVGDVLADEASEAELNEQADSAVQAGAAFPTPVTGVGPRLSDNDRLSRMAAGGGAGVGVALAVLVGLFVIVLAAFFLMKG